MDMSTLKDQIRFFSNHLKHPMFATRSSLAAAIDYASAVADTSDNPAAVYTAVHVVLNAVAKQLDDLADEWQDVAALERKWSLY